MDNGDRQLLIETRDAVMEIKGKLPHMASKDDVTRNLRRHVNTYHPPARTVPEDERRWSRAKTRLVFAITALIAAATTTLAAWRPWE